MDKSELLQAANLAEPEKMKTAMTMVQALEKIAPEYVGGVLQDFETILDVTKEKVADAKSAFGEKALTLGKHVGVAGLTAVGVGLSAAVATDLYDAARRGLTQGRNWRRFVKANPGLMDEVTEPKNVRAIFDMVHRYAPEFTADPMMTASIVKPLATESGRSGMTLSAIKDLISSRKTLLESKRSQFSINPRFGGGKDKKSEELHPDARDAMEYKKNQGSSSPFYGG